MKYRKFSREKMHTVKLKDLESVVGSHNLPSFLDSLSGHLPVCHGGASVEEFMSLREQKEVKFPDSFEIDVSDSSISYYSNDTKFLSMDWEDGGFVMILCFWRAFIATIKMFAICEKFKELLMPRNLTP